MELELPADKLVKKTSVESDLRRIRKHDLRYDVTTESEAIDDFYFKFYTPYITSAHGTSAVITSREAIRSKLPHCELMRITSGGLMIAGSLIVRDEFRPCLWCVGVRDGNPAYLAQGAIFATYYFAFAHLAKQGYRQVSLGWCRAFLNDGVLRYKRKLSPRITRATQNGFAFSFPSCSGVVRSFLLNNPFIFQQSGMLWGALFLESKTQSAEHVAALEKLYLLRGLSGLVRCLVTEPGQASLFEPAGPDS